MSISKIIEKLNRYFSLDEQKRKDKEAKIIEVIKKLKIKRRKVKKAIKNTSIEVEKENFQIQLDAIEKLLSRAKKLI